MDKLNIFSAFLLPHLKYIYLVFSIFSIIILAHIIPPYQSPDETNHFLRAEQVSRGIFVAHFVDQRATAEHHYSTDGLMIYPDSGFYIGSSAIIRTAQFFNSIPFHPENKVSGSELDSAKKVKWNAALAPADFPNTAIYPAGGYILSAAAILIGKSTHMPVLDTLIFARIINGIGCAIICFFALSLANRTRLLLFFVLLLPLSLSLFASVSQDAMLISLSAFMVALIDHIESSETKRYTTPNVILLIVCITVISAARPPYILLITVFLFLHLAPRMKFYSVAIPFVFICVWGLLNAKNYGIAFAPVEMGVNAGLQTRFILSHPFHFAGLFFHFNYNEITDKIRESIGVLGWLDLFFPKFYYGVAYVIFLLTALYIACFDGANYRLRIALVMTGLVTFIAIMTTQYIVWMRLESPGLGGVQSRYFIPVIFFLCMGLAGFSTEQKTGNWKSVIFVVVLAFPLLSQIVMIENIILRYYLT